MLYRRDRSMRFERRKILFVSPYPVYDGVPHAGGQTLNYYLKRFSEDGLFEVAYIINSRFSEQDIESMHLCYAGKARDYTLPLDQGIERFLSSENIPRGLALVLLHGVASKIFWANVIGLFNSVRSMSAERWMPDVVILEFPSNVLLAPLVREIFPFSKLVASIHELLCFASQEKMSYLSFKWGVRDENLFKRLIYSIEVRALSMCDLLVFHCRDDLNNLEKMGCGFRNKSIVISPYYRLMKKKDVEKKGVLFWGSMRRFENIDAVEWFIEKVWCQVRKELGEEAVFYVVGSEGETLAHRYKGKEGIKFTGFVNDPSSYFSGSFCMVAPLRYGAGIKVKVLEGMAFGLPVLTNEEGIRGIPATDRVHYLHCVSEADYINQIVDLYRDPSLQRRIGNAAKELIRMNFNPERSFQMYKNELLNLLKRGESLQREQ